MNLNPALITAADRQSASLQAQGQGDAVARHAGGDWAEHSQANVFSQPYLDAASHTVGPATLRLLVTCDESPADVVLALPLVLINDTPGIDGRAPTVVSQSATVTAAAGSHVEIAVTVISSTAVSYQWFRAILREGTIADTVVIGATHSKLVFDAVTRDNAGQYRCVVSNSYGQAASGYTLLNVT